VDIIERQSFGGGWGRTGFYRLLRGDENRGDVAEKLR
jgi:hypothetical protein